MVTRERQKVFGFIADQRLALAVLVVGLLLTATASGAFAARVAKDRRGELDGLAEQARTAIERRVASYAEPLYGMRGVLSGSQPATRAVFHSYVELANTARRQPGLLVYTFNRFLPAGDVAGFEQVVRTDTSLADDGYPQFRVYPATDDGDDRVVIDYIEPSAGNEAIFGYDVLSDPVRRRAVEEARDSGRLVATAPLRLVQAGEKVGFLLYLPVYRTAQVPDTAPARRRHFAGVVTAAVGLDQMLSGVLGGTDAERSADVQVDDIGITLSSRKPTEAAGTTLFDSARHSTELREAGAAGRSVDLKVGGRRWRLTAMPRPRFGANQAALLPWFVGMGGSTLSVLLASLLVSLSGGKRRAVVSLRRSEEELRTANANLVRSNADLADANQVKDAFLGTISHELRTPLTAISGFSRLLETRWDRLGLEERQESLTMITRSADTLGSLVDDLLEFNRTGDQAPALSLEAVDLGHVVRMAVAELGPLTTTHRLRLSTSQVIALVDRVAVTRILTNLVTNAVKFSPAGTVVTVSIRRDHDKAVLEVADQGSGVPPDLRALVFERFYRGTHGDHARQPGTGIGLAVVKDLAERMGGSVEIMDAPAAAGALFRVQLALAEPALSVAAVQPEKVT